MENKKNKTDKNKPKKLVVAKKITTEKKVKNIEILKSQRFIFKSQKEIKEFRENISTLFRASIVFLKHGVHNNKRLLSDNLELAKKINVDSFLISKRLIINMIPNSEGRKNAITYIKNISVKNQKRSFLEVITKKITKNTEESEFKIKEQITILQEIVNKVAKEEYIPNLKKAIQGGHKNHQTTLENEKTETKLLKNTKYKPSLTYKKGKTK